MVQLKQGVRAFCALATQNEPTAFFFFLKFETFTTFDGWFYKRHTDVLKVNATSYWAKFMPREYLLHKDDK